MKVIIDEKACEKHKMTLEEFLVSLMIRQVKDVHKLTKDLLDRNIIVFKEGNYLITQPWSDTLDEILAESTEELEKTDEELLKLAEEIRKCFPSGKMKDRYGRDTPYYYRCNKSEISKSLKRFFAQGNKYSDEEILDATKRYVESFKGNYAGMRLAKYFIMKNPVKQGEDGVGYVEQVSDLLTFLENKESREGEGEVINSEDWMLNTKN